MMKELRQAIISAQSILGVEIDPEVATAVLMYSVRKCKVIGKDSSYLPILFETELVDRYVMAAINSYTERKEVEECAWNA